MKFASILSLGLVGLTAAQTTGQYTDAKSGITFNALIDTTGYFFGIALPTNTTGNTDFIATIGGKGTGWSGVSLGGDMIGRLLIVAWPNAKAVVSSFRKATTKMGSPPTTTGTFTQTSIANGTYVNTTHWTYTFLCAKCILADKSTFGAADLSASLGYALNSAAPQQKAQPGAAVSKHTTEGAVLFDLKKAQNDNFAVWKGYAGKPAVVALEFEG